MEQTVFKNPEKFLVRQISEIVEMKLTREMLLV